MTSRYLRRTRAAGDTDQAAVDELVDVHGCSLYLNVNSVNIRITESALISVDFLMSPTCRAVFQ